LAKSKLIEGSIPNVSKSGYAKHAVQNFENMSFTKSLFKNLEMIGQVDCKFIAVLEKTKKLILLFDQHAVHERVRLEQLCESRHRSLFVKQKIFTSFSTGYKSASMKLDQDVTIFLPHKDVSLLKRQKTHLNSLGLVVSLFTNGVTVSEVPLCLYNKSKKGVGHNRYRLSQSLSCCF
jgi:DNA mismatch repair ATPase MutL